MHLRNYLFLSVLFLSFGVASQDSKAVGNTASKYGKMPRLKNLNTLYPKPSTKPTTITSTPCINNQDLLNDHFTRTHPLPNADDEPIIRFLRSIFKVKKIPECLPDEAEQE